MNEIIKPTGSLLAVRSHDITTALTGKTTQFEQLVVLGTSVRLALHLQGVMQPIPYEMLKLLAMHVLRIGPFALKPCLELLAEVEFIDLVTEGTTIKSITPRVPYYENLFRDAGQYAEQNRVFTEEEQLTLMLVNRLAESPMNRDTVLGIGAEKKMVKHVLATGRDGGYIIEKRARGKNICMSPIYFAEHADAYADLAAAASSTKVGKVLKALARHQGWPLVLIQQTKMIGDVVLDDIDLAIVNSLAGDGFSLPPAINAPGGGSTNFLFSPRPASTAVAPERKHLQECAMALVSAVRKGQLIPSAYAIRNPRVLLQALRSRGFLRANSEAVDQYRALVALKVGRLEEVPGRGHSFHLVDTKEAKEVVDIALKIISDDVAYVETDPEFMTALRAGEQYVESLSARTTIEADKVVLPEEQAAEIEQIFLKGL